MARRLNLTAPDIGTPDGDRPDGFYLDEGPGDPGTPILADLKNDIYYFFNKTMEEAGITYNNVVDTQTLSQYYNALLITRDKQEEISLDSSQTYDPELSSKYIKIDTSSGVLAIALSDGNFIGQKVIFEVSGGNESTITLTGADVELPSGGNIEYVWNGSEWKPRGVPSVGDVYTQFPGDATPAALGYPGTWSNVSSEMAGDFMRFEGTAGNGGSAAAFESGEVNDAMQRITGSVASMIRASGSAGVGVFSVGSTSVIITAGSGGHRQDLYFDNGDSTSPNIAKTNNVETYPVYKTVRKWRRTA